jgi:hypothetical protein
MGKGSDERSQRGGCTWVKTSQGLPAPTQWELARHTAPQSDGLLEGRGVTADPLIAAFARMPPTVGHPYIRGYIQDMYPRLPHPIRRNGAARLPHRPRTDRRSHQRLCPVWLQAPAISVAAGCRESGRAGECHRVMIFKARNFACDLQAVTGRSLMAIPTLEASLDIPVSDELPSSLV